MQGAAFILGNDLAGGQVFPVMEVVDKPVSSVPDELSQKFLEVFPACVLTSSQVKKGGPEYILDYMFLCRYEEPEVVIDWGDERPKTEKVNDALTLSVTCEEQTRAQKKDVSLTKCFEIVVNENGNASFYFEHELLMRKWKLRFIADAECSSVCQVVVPIWSISIFPVSSTGFFACS